MKILNQSINLDEEKSMLKDLVAPHLRARFDVSFSSIKGRMKFVQKFNHHNVFNHLYKKEIQSRDDSVDGILNILKRKKSPQDCYIISTDSSIDGKRISLEDALNKIHCSQKGSVVCCIPGRLLYYEGKFKARYVIEKIV